MYITFAELKNSFNFNVASFSSAVTLRCIDFTSQDEKLHQNSFCKLSQ